MTDTSVAVTEVRSVVAGGVPVATEVSDWGDLPAVRVTKIGTLEESSRKSTTPLFQVEVWHTDEIEAEELATKLCDDWWDYAAHRATGVGDESTVVYTRWVEDDPRPLPEPDGTAYYRSVCVLGLYLGRTEP